MKHVEVTILGQSYLLGCPANGEAGLLEAVARVDREMSAIRDGGKVRARERIAVLAALNLAYAPVAAARQPGAGVPASPSHGQTDDHDDRMDGLIHRLDAALGADGRSS